MLHFRVISSLIVLVLICVEPILDDGDPPDLKLSCGVSIY